MVKNIFIADDDPDDLEMFSEAVEEVSKDVTCVVAVNGRDLLRKIPQDATITSGIIFLDVNMPEMNGWECLQALKVHEHFKSFPVIIYSTSSAQKDVQKALALGAICFYEKPESFILLRNFVNVILHSRSADARDVATAIAPLSKTQKIYMN